MGEQRSDAMNLDLNLGPIPEPPADSTASENVEAPAIGTAQQVGQDSVESNLRPEEVPKACDNNHSLTSDGESEKDDVGKGIGNGGSFFDCSICLDLAKDPVVTCCGHLFCWPCLFRWLDVHSDAKECPACKGKVSSESITPIYGRGNNNVQDPEEDPTLEIPIRPHARRVETLRPTFQRGAFGNPMEETIGRLGGRVDLSRSNDHETVRENAERTSFLLNRVLTSRAIRRAQNLEASSYDAGYPTGNNMGNLDSGDIRMLQYLLPGRTQSHRATLPSFPSALISGRVDLSRSNDHETVRENAERTSFLLNRARAIRREQNLEASSYDAGYPTGNNMGNLDSGDIRILQYLLPGRTQSRRATLPSFPSALISGRVDLSRSNDHETVRENAERTSFLLNRVLTSRANRREQNLEASSYDAGYPTGNNMGNLDSGDIRMLQYLLPGRTQSHRATLPSVPSALISAERMVETYFRPRAGARNQEQAPAVDDRDSSSRIAAVINSGSQADNAVEIDSRVSLSTPSSRRRNDYSRVSDVDTVDSRSPRPRRRRLH